MKEIIQKSYLIALAFGLAAFVMYLGLYHDKLEAYAETMELFDAVKKVLAETVTIDVFVVFMSYLATNFFLGFIGQLASAYVDFEEEEMEREILREIREEERKEAAFDDRMLRLLTLGKLAAMNNKLNEDE